MDGSPWKKSFTKNLFPKYRQYTTNFVEHSDIKRTTTPNIFKNKVKKVILDCQGEGETIEWEVDNFF